MRKIQRLRGQAYLEDGAIREQDLSWDGCFEQPMDDLSWHLVGLGEDGEPISCLRYRKHENTANFEQLTISGSALARSSEWGLQTRIAVERDLELARKLGVPYVELGAWAIAPAARYSAEVLRIVLATYATWRMLGGALGIGMVTHRHRSASIVERLGGRRLSVDGQDLPKYADPRYGCEMELLRFSSDYVASRFASCVDDFEWYLERSPVILGGNSTEDESLPAVAASSHWEDSVLCLQ